MDELPDELLLKLCEEMSLGDCIRFGATSRRHHQILSSVCSGREELKEVIIVKRREEATRVLPNVDFVVRHLSESIFKLCIIADDWSEDLVELLESLVDACPNITSVSLESTGHIYDPDSDDDSEGLLRRRFLSNIAIKSLDVFLVGDQLFSEEIFSIEKLVAPLQSLESLTVTGQLGYYSPSSLSIEPAAGLCFDTLKVLDVDVAVENPAFAHLTNLEQLSLRRLRLADRKLVVWPNKLKTLRISGDSETDSIHLYEWIFSTDLKDKSSLEQVHLAVRPGSPSIDRRLSLPAQEIADNLKRLGLHLFKSLFFSVADISDWKTYIDFLNSMSHDLDRLWLMVKPTLTDEILSASSCVATRISHLSLASLKSESHLWNENIPMDVALKISSSFVQVKFYDIACLPSNPTMAYVNTWNQARDSSSVLRLRLIDLTSWSLKWLDPFVNSLKHLRLEFLSNEPGDDILETLSVHAPNLETIELEEFEEEKDFDPFKYEQSLRSIGAKFPKLRKLHIKIVNEGDMLDRGKYVKNLSRSLPAVFPSNVEFSFDYLEGPIQNTRLTLRKSPIGLLPIITSAQEY